MTHRLSDIIAEMERIERAEEATNRREIRDEERIELAFIRLLRNAFTEFLEAKGWVRTVGADYWRGESSSEGMAGLRFEVNVSHPDFEDFGDIEMVVEVKRGSN